MLPRVRRGAPRCRREDRRLRGKAAPALSRPVSSRRGTELLTVSAAVGTRGAAVPAPTPAAGPADARSPPGDGGSAALRMRPSPAGAALRGRGSGARRAVGARRGEVLEGAGARVRALGGGRWEGPEGEAMQPRGSHGCLGFQRFPK